jgi:hypothetical protein
MRIAACSNVHNIVDNGPRIDRPLTFWKLLFLQTRILLKDVARSKKGGWLDHYITFQGLISECLVKEYCTCYHICIISLVTTISNLFFAMLPVDAGFHNTYKHLMMERQASGMVFLDMVQIGLWEWSSLDIIASRLPSEFGKNGNVAVKSKLERAPRTTTLII